MPFPSRARLLRYTAGALVAVVPSMALLAYSITSGVGGHTPAWMETFPGEALFAVAATIALPGFWLMLALGGGPAPGALAGWVLAGVSVLVCAAFWGSLAAWVVTWFRRPTSRGRARQPPR